MQFVFCDGSVRAISQADDPDASLPQRIPPRYNDFATSGLQFTVEPGSNRFDIQLQP